MHLEAKGRIKKKSASNHHHYVFVLVHSFLSSPDIIIFIASFISISPHQLHQFTLLSLLFKIPSHQSSCLLFLKNNNNSTLCCLLLLFFVNLSNISNNIDIQ